MVLEVHEEVAVSILEEEGACGAYLVVVLLGGHPRMIAVRMEEVVGAFQAWEGVVEVLTLHIQMMEVVEVGFRIRCQVGMEVEGA